MRLKLLRVLCGAALVLAGCATSKPQPATQTAPRVLFIGNSLTYGNNLPQIFHHIVVSAGHAPPQVKAITPGGVGLEQHFKSADTLKLVDQGPWDLVVLQARGAEAAQAEELPAVRQAFLKSVAGLYQRIKAASPKAKVIYYQTWAPHPDYWQSPKAVKGIGKNPTEAQARSRKWVKIAVAKKKDFLIAPAGDAWELNYKQPHALQLHLSDGIHPTFSGSYLAALVLYGTIYQPPNLELAYRGELSADTAAYLQKLAAQSLRKN